MRNMSLKVTAYAIAFSGVLGFLGAFTTTILALTSPVPQINQPLGPNATTPGGQGFTLKVNGTGFVSGSSVTWNGSPRATSFISSTKLTALITAEDVESPGTAWVTVVNGNASSNVAFFEITNPTASVSFARSDYNASTGTRSIVTADFNRDGRLDLAVANQESNDLNILLGNADGTFQTPVNYAIGSGPQSVTFGDLNEDGNLDLVTANEDSNDVTILLGNGDGTFQSALSYPVGSFPHYVAVGDFDCDGKLDLAVANTRSASVSVLLGYGDGTFHSATNYAAGSGPWDVALGDLNADGAIDLVVTDFTGNSFSVLLGNRDGTFQTPQITGVSTNPYFLVLGDFNGDRKLDLVLTYSASNYVAILLGNGNGTFQSAVNYETGQSPSEPTVGDFNGDNKLDLIVPVQGNNSVSLLLGNGDGTLQPGSTYATGNAPTVITAGDFNSDGRLDIAVANYSSNNVSILLQPKQTSGFAQLEGGNTFTGNQSVNGSMTATNFVGNGSGLTGVDRFTRQFRRYRQHCQFCHNCWNGRYSQQCPLLGGLAAINFARLDTNNGFNGAQSIAGTIDVSGHVAAQNLSAENNQDITAGFFKNNANVGSNDALFAEHTGFGNAIHALNTQYDGTAATFEATAPGRSTRGVVATVASPLGVAAIFKNTGNGKILSLQNNTGELASVDGDGIFHFAPGQTFSGNGSGGITGVTAGSGLLGGGSSGNVSLAVDSSVARTNAGNNFTGSQTVSGAVTATSFLGDGSSLTNLSGSKVTGSVASAVTAGTAAAATNALALGGVAPSGYAPSSGSPSYVAKAGDTMTGVLNLPANGLAIANNQLILTNGEVGIGTSSPGASLEVRGNDNTQLRIGRNTGPSQYMSLWFGTTDGVLDTIGAGFGFQILTNGQPNTTFLNGNGQVVHGNVTATSFTGDGSHLTNVNAASASTAATATTATTASFATSAGAAASATTAANAANATNLGGVAAGSYARLDIANNFTGNQTVTGNLIASGIVTIGGGTAILKHLSILVNPTIGALKQSTCATANFSLPGATDGDSIALGIPNARMLGGGILNYFAWVSAADTITVRACNIDPNSKQTSAGSGAIRIDLWKH